MSVRCYFIRALSIALPLAIPAPTFSQQPTQPAPTSSAIDTATPKLVLFITVDAMRPDYLSRFESQLTGGLGRLYRGGAFFANAFQDHAITETAPGHSVTMSGRFPVHTGISMNIAGVSDTSVRLIDASGSGASPFRFRGTTLTDWLLAKDPRTRVLSVSRKDRAAILPIGRSKQSVFWYAGGNFTTSTYYASTLPEWVKAYNARKVPLTYAGRVWRLLLPDSAYAEPDSVPYEAGAVGFMFPHVEPTAPDSAVAFIAEFPWMDEITLDFALSGVKALGLGSGPQTDLLAISLSTTDAIGHKYGPDSRELHDQILRLDRALGSFLDSLFKIRSEKDVVIALTADHGMTPYPEVHTSHDQNAGARRVYIRPVLERLSNALRTRGVSGNGLDYVGGIYSGNGFTFDSGVLQLDRVALQRANINVDTLLATVRADFLKVPGVARAERISALAAADTVNDRIARRWLHMFNDESTASMVVTLAPYNYWLSYNLAQHGSPNDSDAHVPIIFYGSAFKPGRYPDFATVADMAPTLAAVAHVTPLEKLDGHVLQNAIR